MTRVAEYLGNVDFLDKDFIGTVTFRNEELSLPNGNKIALGIDGAHWVLVYQEKAGAQFTIFECDWREKKINVDKKSGSQKDLKFFIKLVSYFLAEAKVDELVTIQPPSAEGP